MPKRQQIRVLVVEDDPEDYELTRGLLAKVSERRYTVEWAETYDAGLAALRAASYDICLVDYYLGSRKGPQFMRECASSGIDTAMILLTGSSARETDHEALQAGAADYVDKSQVSSPLLDRSIRYALEHKKTLLSLQESRAFLRSTLDSLSTAIAILDSSGTVMSTNDSWNRVAPWAGVLHCGVGANYLLACEAAAGNGMAPAATIADGIRRVMSAADDIFYCEYASERASECRWIALRVTRFNGGSGPCVVLAHENITERKQAEEQRQRADLLKVLHSELESVVARRTAELRSEILQRQEAEIRLQASVQEKEVLLREIHHRVKNNLQVISSLLNLQAMTAKHQAVREVLIESQNRVLSMALIHEQLYGSSDFSSIDIGRYVKQLLQHIFSSFGDRATNITPRVMASERIVLTLEQAIPCGLIINELVSNALKHAFSNRPGEVRVALLRQDANVCIRVSDSGTGLPDGFNAGSPNSLGLRIVNTLTRQLRGSFAARNASPGAVFELIFQEDRHVHVEQ